VRLRCEEGLRAGGVYSLRILSGQPRGTTSAGEARAERLMASDLTRNTRAWRLWAACVDATVGYTREADQTDVVGLATRAGMERPACPACPRSCPGL
jgi:hypothetical protein